MSLQSGPNLFMPITSISTKVRGVFSDNYFDMLPGEVQMIDFEPSENVELKKSDLRVRTLYEIMN